MRLDPARLLPPERSPLQVRGKRAGGSSSILGSLSLSLSEDEFVAISTIKGRRCGLPESLAISYQKLALRQLDIVGEVPERQGRGI